MMSKRARQYLGLASAILAYYLLHEGAHLVYALVLGVFKQINFMGLGVQIDVFAEQMSSTQLGWFCLWGSICTAVAAYTLMLLTGKITKSKSKPLKACLFYITIALLLLDPLYLSALCGLFGGGDMNGISLLIPELWARMIYGALLIINAILFLKVVLPKYQESFKEK